MRSSERSARKRRPERPACAAAPACSTVRRSAGGVASGANGPPRRLIAQTWKVSVFESSRIIAAPPLGASPSASATLVVRPTARSALSDCSVRPEESSTKM